MSIEWLKDVIIPLASGIGGAIIGAGASYFASSRLAKRSSDEVLERDKASRHDQDLRAAHQVFVKLYAIANSLCTFHNDLEEQVAKADRDGNSHMPLHERLSARAGIDREPSIEFTADELAIYIAAKQPDYVNDLLLLSRRYNAHLTNLATFASLKIELHRETTRLGKTTRAETGVSTTVMRLPAEVANYINTKRQELDIFATAMREHLAQDDKFARDVASRFGNVTGGYLGPGILDFVPTEELEPSNIAPLAS
jgi:hypothetical protein